MTPPADPGSRRRGPRSGGADTRAAILAGASDEFIEKGFAAAKVRDIAARAGVDAAMINHYFGSKSGLFREVTHIPVDPAVGLAAALAGPREHLGHRLTLFVLRTWEDPAFRDPVLALLRSAPTEGDGTALLRGYFSSQLIPLVVAQARGNDPMGQTVLALAQVIGVVVGRHLIELPQLTEPSITELAEGIAPAVQRYLDGESDS